MEQNKTSKESDVIKTTEKAAYDNFSKDGAGIMSGNHSTMPDVSIATNSAYDNFSKDGVGAMSGNHIPIPDDHITSKPDEKVIKVAVAKDDVLNHEPPMRPEPPMKR